MSTQSTSNMKIRLTLRDICMIGMMVAVIEVCKVALSWLPNIELTSFWLIMFTLFFGAKIVFVVPVFILIEGAMYGVGLWWIMYLYAWPILVLLTYLLRKSNNKWTFTILSAMFGLSFGFLCSFPYFFIGWSTGGLINGITTAFTWWVAGIPWDLVHCGGNFVLMMVLYEPVSLLITKLKKTGGLM